MICAVVVAVVAALGAVEEAMEDGVGEREVEE